MLVGDVREPDPDGFRDAVDADVADPGKGLWDLVTAGTPVAGSLAEDQGDVIAFGEPQRDPRGEQVPHRQDLLTRVLHRIDHTHPDRAALGEQQRQRGSDPPFRVPVNHVGPRGVSVQLAAQAAKAWARLRNGREVEVALDRGRQILEDLAPTAMSPDDHFVIDPAKWHFYEMDAYRNMGQDALAQAYAEEVLRLGTSEFGEERSPMRNAEARLTLGVIAARAGDVDEAVSQGIRALAGGRQSIPSLAMVAQELIHELQAPQYVGNARASEFREEVARSEMSATATS